MFVCLFFFVRFVSIVTYPGNKLRGNWDCEIIIRRGGGGGWGVGGGLKRKGGQCKRGDI